MLNFTKGSSRSFLAEAEIPLEIENDALGYKIKFILDGFRAEDNELSYYGQTQFLKQQSQTEKERAKWQKNRQTAYLGSLKHFLVSVLYKKEKSEGFIVYQLADIGKERLEIIPSRINKFPITIEKGPLPHERYISFPGILKIDYTKERVEDEYSQGENQTSWIEMTDSSVTIDTTGNLLYQQTIKQYGYWGWKRIGNLLPMDYRPSTSLLFYSDHTPSIDFLEKEENIGKTFNGKTIVIALDELVFKNCNHKKLIEQLYKDIIDIISDDESKNWKRLKTNQQKVEFLRRFWLFRDLSVKTKTNERLEEHYTRLQFARTIYSTITPEGYDDRGRIYVKYGEPEARQVDVMPNYRDIEKPEETVGGRSLETWVYSFTGNQIVFNFVDKSWGYSLAYLAEDILPRWMEPESDRRNIAIREILRYRADLDIRFASPPSQGGGLEMAFNHILREQQIEQQKIPITVSKEFEDIYELNFSFQPALFENSPYEHTLVMAYGLREDDVNYSKSDLENQQEVEVVTLLRAPSLFDIASFEKNIPIKKESFDKNGEFIHQIKTPVAYNSFYILVDASNPKGSQKALKDYSIRRPTISSQQLHLSSVVFAKEISPFDEAIKDSSLLIRNDLNIKMYPFTELRNSDPIHLYFEIYGLQKDNSKKTHYDIEYSVEPEQNKNLITYLSKLNPFKKDAGKISISYSQEGNKTNDYFSVQLNLSQLKSGNYNLVARVTDSISKETKESKIAFVLK